MCGILGTINRPFGPASLDLLRHRGPDNGGEETITVGRHLVQLGQRRLAIVDLSAAGHQPMVSEDGRYSLIYNGELYNHQDLRAKLPATIAYRGHSDTETMLYYLMEYGMAGVADFNGIFAFAFLDREEGKLYLARDPFGVKPLYYRWEAESLVFSSELRPIRHLTGAAELDKEALATLLRLRYNPAPDTLDRGTEKIRPGHYLDIDLGAADLTAEHHAYLAPLPQTHPRPRREAVTRYGELLTAAVDRQLLADVEVGVLLSGGVDSAAVAALAGRRTDRPLKAFTIGFAGEHQEDEIADAAETAALLGMEHHVKRIDFTDFLGTMRECIRIVEEPLATTSILPMYFLAELAARHVKVVLTGQGADEPLGGYTRYKAELMQHYVPDFLRGMLAAAPAKLGVRNETLLRGAGAMGITDEVQRFLKVYQVFSPAEIEELTGLTDTRSGERIDYFYRVLNCAAKDRSVERMMALDSRLNLADDLLTYTDKLTMNFSLECRVPLLDLELVRYIESLPAAARLNLRGGKLVHKRLARRLLPAAIVNRKKRGFASPTQRWFREEVGALRDLLLRPGTPFAATFNQRAVAAIIDQHQAGYNREKQLFLLLSIQFWLELRESELTIKKIAICA